MCASNKLPGTDASGPADLWSPRPAAAWSRISVPGQRLKSGRGSESAESSPLDQWPATRPWAVSCVEMNFHRETESSEASKVFTRRKRVCVGRRKGGLSERARPLVVVWIIYVGRFFRVSFGQSSCFAWFWVRLVYLRVLPCVHTHLLAKMDSGKDAYG